MPSWPAVWRSGALLGLALWLPLGALAQDWELREEQDGIRVSTRPVPGSGIAAFRGEARVEAPLEAIVAVLMKAEDYPQWFPDCPTARELSRDGDVQVRYAVTSAPWPVDPRDAVYRYEVTRDAAAGSARIQVDVLPDAHPEQDGHVRVREAEGRWTLTPDGDATQIVWEMHLEPGGALPDWLINARVVDTPMGALRGLREQVAR